MIENVNWICFIKEAFDSQYPFWKKELMSLTVNLCSKFQLENSCGVFLETSFWKPVFCWRCKPETDNELKRMAHQIEIILDTAKWMMYIWVPVRPCEIKKALMYCYHSSDILSHMHSQRFTSFPAARLFGVHIEIFLSWNRSIPNRENVFVYYARKIWNCTVLQINQHIQINFHLKSRPIYIREWLQSLDNSISHLNLLQALSWQHLILVKVCISYYSILFGRTVF